MKIVIDIDDTICITSPEWTRVTEQYMAKHNFKRKRKTDLYDLALSFKLTEAQKKAYYDYMKDNFSYYGLKPVPGASEFIHKLIQAGHTVELLTARPMTKYSETVGWLMRELDILSIPINYKTYLEGLQMDLLIDNSEKRIKQALARGIPAILFTGVAPEKERPSDIKTMKKSDSFEKIYQMIVERSI